MEGNKDGWTLTVLGHLKKLEDIVHSDLWDAIDVNEVAEMAAHLQTLVEHAEGRLPPKGFDPFSLK